MSHPYPQPPAPAAQPEVKNGLSTAGFVLGLVGLVVALIPVVGVIAWPMVILGIIFSAIGLRRPTKRGLSIAGLVLSILGLLVCILWAAAFGKAVNDVNEEANSTATVVYEVNGDAPNVSVTYSTYGNGELTTSQETVATLPWRKEVDATGLGKGGTLTVMTSVDGGSVTCKVSVGSEEVKTAQASGPMALASC